MRVEITVLDPHIPANMHLTRQEVYFARPAKPTCAIDMLTMRREHVPAVKRLVFLMTGSQCTPDRALNPVVHPSPYNLRRALLHCTFIDYSGISAD